MQISIFLGIQPEPKAVFIQTRLVTLITSPDFLCEGGGESYKILSSSGSSLLSSLVNLREDHEVGVADDGQQVKVR